MLSEREQEVLQHTARDLAGDRALARRLTRHAIGFRWWWHPRTLLGMVTGLLMAGSVAVSAAFSLGSRGAAVAGFAVWAAAWAAAGAALARLAWLTRPFRGC